MDIITAFSGIGAAFGLSTSAGLNAYIPLLIVALAARFPTSDPLLHLAEPYNLLGHWGVILVLGLLLAIEVTVDKVPAVDTVNDVIQTFIRPAAGAILFAANANVISEINPILALIAGLLLAGTVHTTKGIARPMVTATTAGTGNWLVSAAEDILAVILSLLAVLIPLLALLFLLGVFIAFVLLYRRRRKRRYALDHRPGKP